MKKFISLLLAFVLAISPVWGAIYYDADTNSYVVTNDDEEVDTDEQDDSDTTEDEDTTDEDDDTTEDDNEDEDQDDTESQVNITQDRTYDGPLSDLHEQLDDNTTDLLNQLDDYHDELSDMADAVKAGSGGAIRFDVLKCLELIETDQNFDEELDTVYQQLYNQIAITQKDIHSNITALEGKIEDDLLNQLNQRLETSSVTNKVETYHTEFTDVVDTFYELFEEYISEADQLAEDASQENKDLLEGYDERVEEYEELEAAYDEFVKKSSFAGVIAGPNIQALYEIKDQLHGYYASQLWTERHDAAVVYVPSTPAERATLRAKQQELANNFQTRFNTYADELLEGLYPVEDLLLLHKSILSLRSAYTDNSGSYDCKAFATNRTIEASGPELQNYMDEVLSNLNKYVQEIADNELPSDAEALKEGLREGLSEQTSEIIDELVAQHKRQLQQEFSEQGLTFYETKRPSQLDNEEQMVRNFLQEMYKRYMEDDNLDTFFEKLEDANEKLDPALEQVTHPVTKQRLEMIQKVVLEFI